MVIAHYCVEHISVQGEIYMDKIMMWIMAICALIGGTDRLLGNRLGLGKRFEDGFQLLGPTALSMAGLICITPLVSLGLEYTIVPFYRMLHLDPGMLGGILALDMGGYQLCKELALDLAIGRYGGIIVGATLGCTITFTIPVGMGMLGEREKPLFAKGILAGLSALPVGILVGGLLCGLSIGKLLIQSIPVFLLAVLLILGLSRFPDGMIRGFRVFAEIIRGAGTIGIALGAFSYMTGVQLLPEMTGLDEALGVVSSIGIVLLGSLPFAEILQRLLKKPLEWVGEKIGLGRLGTAGLLVGIVSALPVIADMKQMNEREIVMNAALLVCGTSMVAAHLGFVLGVDAPATGALLAGKLTGGIAGVWMAWQIMKKTESSRDR